MLDPKRKIPYNYTSADDDQIINHLFGSQFLKTVQHFEPKKDTGRSSRLLHRFMGDLFIIERNQFLFQELVEHPKLRKYLFTEFQNDLDTIEKNAEQDDVFRILNVCKEKLNALLEKIVKFQHQKHTIVKHLSRIIGKKNIYFDAFNITTHCTDATDWRLYMPVAILRPDREDQVPCLITRIKNLGFQIIPRGAGTGLTGGATPLNPNCIMLNTEKLNTIGDIEYHTNIDGKRFASLFLGAGVITQDAIDFADENGFIFATDPTSAWACTIGGNLAENAGGKKAVLFGTAIDNVLSYRITMPDGDTYHVKRKDHPSRKIENDETILFEIFDNKGYQIKTITLDSNELRKKGCGKDVTNKALNGLYGIQKEGCDGIITSAQFILYPKFEFKKTICIEFFGNDMSQAGQVIAQIIKSFPDHRPAIMALEHFDEEYIKAIKYKTKTSVGNRLIAVLLVDMVSNIKSELLSGVERIQTLLDPYDKTGFSVARNEKEANRFWQDRKRLGAIAAHTNAFKLNEDIVLPTGSLAQFASWVDQCNIKEKKINQRHMIDNIIHYLDTAIPLADPELLQKRVGQAKDLAYATKKKMDIASRDALEAFIHAKNFYSTTLDNLRGYTLVTENVTKIYETTRSRLIVIATHMHAGDGNVHVNIPVLSNDREMMKRANEVADKVMDKALQLNGVVSGEHGIGITKIKHLDSDILQDFAKYRKNIDPDGLMNPNKFVDLDIIKKVYTPSFNLLEIEARILNHNSLSQLAMKVASCVRCGKCKIQCPVFYPKQNLFFHPRNKNLAIGSLIEALLYISQRTQSTGDKVLKHVEQIADHCTICHKCFLKCPVNIDSGEISISERYMLEDKGFKHGTIPTKATLTYLATNHRVLNPILRTSLLTVGSKVQRVCSRLFSSVAKKNQVSKFKIVQMLNSPVGKPHSSTLRSHLPRTNKNQAIVIEPESAALKTVFYFPGCGSERMFSKVSMASIYLLLKNKTRIILPPSYLCCGYPFLVNAKKQTYDTIMLENIIIFSQIRSMFQDFSFDACVVSCGTCMESLIDLSIGEMFECQARDISEFVMNIDTKIGLDQDYLYHTPCHDSLNNNAVQLFKPRQNGYRIFKTPHCCSEAGTLAISRPQISNAMLKRKQTAVIQMKPEDSIPMLTNCPSCIQGLGRLGNGKLSVFHLAEKLAQIKGGKNWEKGFKALVSKSEVVTF